MDVVSLHVTRNLSDNLFDQLLELVPHEQRSRILRFRRRSDAQRSLLGEVMWRVEVSKRTGIPIKSIKATRNEYGKPILVNGDWHFNVSHSNEWVVCVLDSEPVGIDVECVAEIDLSLVKHVLCDEEVHGFLPLSQREKIARFFQTWSIKESCLKCWGVGLSLPMNTLHVNFTESTINALHGEQNVMRYKLIDLDSRYVFAVCKKGLISQLNVAEFDLELLQTS